MPDYAFRAFASRLALDTQLVEAVADIIVEAVAAKGSATLVVSGGSTPLNFFRLLSQQPLPWQRVTVTLADERWVDPAHPDSNERLVRDNLLINFAAEAQFLSLWNGAPTAVAGAAERDAQVAALGRFDLVILGMGADGHTASLFPQAVALATGLDLHSGRACIAVDPVTATHPRVSLTLPRLLDSRQLFIHITGAEKKSVLARAIAADGQPQLPVAAVLQQQCVPVTVFWAE